VQAVVVRARSRGRAVEQGKAIHEHGGGITYRARRAREGPGAFWSHRRSHPCERNVRSERAPLHLVPHISGSELHVSTAT